MSVDMILVADLVAPLAAIDTRERTAAHPGANPARRWSPASRRFVANAGGNWLAGLKPKTQSARG